MHGWPLPGGAEVTHLLEPRYFRHDIPLYPTYGREQALQCIYFSIMPPHRMVSGGIFRHYLGMKEEDRMLESLKAFRKEILQGTVPSLETLDLYLVGLARLAMDVGAQQGVVDALAEVFNLLVKRSVGIPVLGSLSLKVCTTDETGERIRPCNIHGGDSSVIDESSIQLIRDSYREDRVLQLRRAGILNCASTTMNSVTQALRSSQLQMENLKLFHSADMQECSIPCGTFLACGWESEEVKSALAHTKSIWLRICNPVFLTNPDTEARSPDFFDGLVKLTESCPMLENLDLTYSRIENRSKPNCWTVLTRPT